MRVFAIDPGFGRCGIAVVERVGSRDTVLASDCIETSPKLTFPERLDEVVRACTRYVAAHEPDIIALEKLFFSNNQKTAMQVAEVRGALLGLAGSLGIPVVEYAPGEIKSAIAGSGRADKKQIAKMIHLLVQLDARSRLDDEYDAIALGLTHLAYAR